MRLIVLNDGYEAVAFDRRLLVGPNFAAAAGGAGPLPMAMEPVFAEETANHVVLNPFCFYGRERSQEDLPPGEITVEGFMLARTLDQLGPEGLGAEGAVTTRAEPLRLVIE